MPADESTFRLELFVPGLSREAAFEQFLSELENVLELGIERFEPGPDGRWFEVLPTGRREFARVTRWEPGQRIELSWHPVISTDKSAGVPVGFRFDEAEGGTRVILEYGPWPSSNPLAEGAERLGWFVSAVIPTVLHATSPTGFGDWWTDRIARRPAGAAAEKTYSDPLYHRPNFRLILDRLHLTADDCLLEVGCGGGAFLHDALASGCRAWGIDHSPAMVRLAREKNRLAIEEKRLEIRLGDAHHLGYPDASCTCAISTGSFGFWERPVDALTEIHRVLEPGGRLIIFSGTKELRGTPAAPEPVASRIHWYEDDELATLARNAGFVEIRVDRPDLGPYARLAALPPEALAFFENGPPSAQVLEARRAIREHGG